LEGCCQLMLNMTTYKEHQEEIDDAEEILVGAEWMGCVFMFNADQWYEALALILSDRSPA
jgi:hypothetical protein